MRTDEFDYPLPPQLIAQRPARPRDASRLLQLKRSGGQPTHHLFRDLPHLLQPGDALVVNNTRVLRSRLVGRKQATGGRVELLLLQRERGHQWLAMVGGKSIQPGLTLEFAEGLTAEVVADLGDVRRRIVFNQDVLDRLETVGQVPLPPYIQPNLSNAGDYQTVYASQPGSAAAPTAGLHFTARLLQTLEQAGIRRFQVTLHIGLDTFAPVVAEQADQHPIHSEWCSLSADTAESLRKLRQDGGRIIAVGTTAVRTLETAARTGALMQHSGPTDLFILPGYEFRAIDGMITNFHLPRSTLLMLVSALVGRRRLLEAYETAIDSGYRFYSYGDAMLLL